MIPLIDIVTTLSGSSCAPYQGILQRSRIMSSPFASEERFPIVVKWSEVTTKSGATGNLIIRDKEQEERYKGTISELQTQWVTPNWKQSSNVLASSYQSDPQTGELRFVWSLYRSLILDNFMRSWDATGEDEKPVPCTPENISKLDPAIAAALVEGFLAKTNVSEKDLGE